jgi:hypothetical protein
MIYEPKTKLPKITWRKPHLEEVVILPNGRVVDISRNALLDNLIFKPDDGSGNTAIWFVGTPVQ